MDTQEALAIVHKLYIQYKIKDQYIMYVHKYMYCISVHTYVSIYNTNMSSREYAPHMTHMCTYVMHTHKTDELQLDVQGLLFEVPILTQGWDVVRVNRLNNGENWS